jgi:hypothetical protein
MPSLRSKRLQLGAICIPAPISEANRDFSKICTMIRDDIRCLQGENRVQRLYAPGVSAQLRLRGQQYRPRRSKPAECSFLVPSCQILQVILGKNLSVEVRFDELCFVYKCMLSRGSMKVVVDFSDESKARTSIICNYRDSYVYCTRF